MVVVPLVNHLDFCISHIASISLPRKGKYVGPYKKNVIAFVFKLPAFLTYTSTNR